MLCVDSRFTHICGRDDWNKVLDDGTPFANFCPDWKNAIIWDEWMDYARKSFGHGSQHFSYNLSIVSWTFQIMMRVEMMIVQRQTRLALT
jgi:hypothetical protein